jgi:hypothetical protein
MCAETLGARLTRLCLTSQCLTLFPDYALEADGWGRAAARDPARALLPLPKFVRLQELELDYTRLARIPRLTNPVPRLTNPDDFYAGRARAEPTPAEMLAPVEALLAPLPRLRPPALRRLRVALIVSGDADALERAAGQLEARYAPCLSLELRLS